MHKPRHFSFADQLCIQLDKAVRTIFNNLPEQSRVNPGDSHSEQPISDTTKRHIAGLMRINYTGEVCAQALYQGQALTARSQEIKAKMQHCADEENDHLNWCAQRLEDFDSRTSYLNPVWYSLSFGIGIMAGLAGDKWSLGFLAETEHQVVRHLESHLSQIPEQDQKTKAILDQMIIDEAEHACTAEDAGANTLPPPIKLGMRLLSKVMTTTTYRI